MWNATSVVVSLGHCASDPIGMNRGLPQGAPESPMIFTLLIDMVLSNVAEKWRLNGWGFSVDAFYVSGIAYADDIVLVAHSPAHLQLMAADIAQELRAIGLGIGAAKTHWTSTPALVGAQLVVEGTSVEWEPAITFVGTVVDLRGTCGPAFAYRMAQADKCFAKWRGIDMPARLTQKAARTAPDHSLERSPLVVVYMVYDESTKVAARKLERQSDCKSGQGEAQRRHGQCHPLEIAASHGSQACGQPGHCSCAEGEITSLQVGRPLSALVAESASGGGPQVQKPSVVEMEAATFPFGTSCGGHSQCSSTEVSHTSLGGTVDSAV
jgi:hypothetical protein